MPLGPEADLNWTAFLYVTGELPELEEADFELMLADDQAAREAVAAAVEIAGAMASLAPRDWTRRRSNRWAVVGSSLAAAACLVIAGLWMLRSEPTDRPSSEVALTWSGLRQIEGVGEPDPIAPSDELPSASEPDASSDSTLPSWLLSAAASPVGDSPREEN